MGTCVASAVGLLSFGLYIILQMSSTTGACVDESIPPVVPPTTWTGWFSVDDPTDGTDNETLGAVRSVYPSVCVSPTKAECRVKFIHTDHVTARQSLASSCTPAAGLMCQNSDQPPLETCLDYEIRFECPIPGDTLPDPHVHWDLSGKANKSDEDPISCGGPIVSIYPNKGGTTGVVEKTPPTAAESFNSSDHLCALRNVNGDIFFGTAANKCISETSCCTSGWTVTYWMRYRSLPSNARRYMISTGGHDSTARGFCIYMTRKFALFVRGDLNNKAWEMKIDTPDLFPTDVWTHHCFTYNAVDGTRYYKNGVLGFSLETETRIETTHTTDTDRVRLLASNSVDVSRPEGDFSDFKMFYRTFNDTEVQTAYHRETSESNLVIHYLVEHSTDNAFDVELKCLAKSGSQPTITWYRSDDGSHFYLVSPSSIVDIIESFPNNYRTQSELKIRNWNSTSDVIIACEALDAVGSRGSISKKITIPKVTTTSQPTTTQTTPQPTTISTTKEVTTRATTDQPTTSKPSTAQTTVRTTTIPTTKDDTTIATSDQATTTVQSTLVPTTEEATARATTVQPTTGQPTTTQTTVQPTTMPTTEEATTRATTVQPTTGQPTTTQTTAQPTTMPTTEKETTRATTVQPTTDQPTTTQTTMQPTTVPTTEEATTRATTQLETTAADITSAISTTLGSCSDGQINTLQMAIQCSNASVILGQDGELQDGEKKSLLDFLKLIPTLAFQQLPDSETKGATELVLQVYSRLTDPDQTVSVEDHMSVSTDVEDAMEYLAGTLGQGNCTRASYETASVSLCHSPTLSPADGFRYSHKVEAEPGDKDNSFEEELTLDVPKGDASTDTVTIVILRKKTPVQEFNGTSAVQFPEETINNMSTPDTASVSLNSAILTFSLFINHKRRSIPVNFSLYHFRDAVDEFTEEGAVNATRKTACVFWVDGTENKNGQWSTSGCRVTTDKSSSSCSCDHSSNFAVLMQVTEYKISEADSLALMWITYIGCCVSIVLLLLTLAIYAFLWRRLRSDRIFIHSSLSVAILTAQVLFIGGIERTDDKVFCTIIAILLHFFYLSVFGWMLVEGIHLYKKVIKVYGSENIKMYPYLLVGWGVPAVITLVSLSIRIEGYGAEGSCWLDISSGLIWAFVGPALGVIGVNIVVFVLVLRIIVKSAELSNDKEHANIKAGMKGAVVLLPILGLTWVFGLLAVNRATIVFQYLFAIFNSFQGLFIFLNQCAFNSEVKAAFLRIREKRKLTLGTSASTDQPAQFASSSVTQNTEVRTVSGSDNKKHVALDDDLKVETVENSNFFEDIQDLEKTTEPVSDEPQRNKPYEFYKLPPSANLNPLLLDDQVCTKTQNARELVPLETQHVTVVV